MKPSIFFFWLFWPTLLCIAEDTSHQLSRYESTDRWQLLRCVFHIAYFFFILQISYYRLQELYVSTHPSLPDPTSFLRTSVNCLLSSFLYLNMYVLSVTGWEEVKFGTGELAVSSSVLLRSVTDSEDCMKHSVLAILFRGHMNHYTQVTGGGTVILNIFSAG